jgi:YgiT-type zinc finger domain-containing protein
MHLKRNSDPSLKIPCSECSVGQMHKTRVAYFTWMGEELISVPDFPAWVCDICGRREYDTQALNQLSRLLSPTPGKKMARKPSRYPRKPTGKHKDAQPSNPD